MQGKDALLLDALDPHSPDEALILSALSPILI
jgi:hypothetical protein